MIKRILKWLDTRPEKSDLFGVNIREAWQSIFIPPPPEDQKRCHCCNTMVPYPTTPGKWEYLEPLLMHAYNDKEWNKVTIERHEEGLQIIPIGEKDPIWWPNNVMWRKR